MEAKDLKKGLQQLLESGGIKSDLSLSDLVCKCLPKLDRYERFTKEWHMVWAVEHGSMFFSEHLEDTVPEIMKMARGFGIDVSGMEKLMPEWKVYMKLRYFEDELFRWPTYGDPKLEKEKHDWHNKAMELHDSVYWVVDAMKEELYELAKLIEPKL